MGGGLVNVCIMHVCESLSPSSELLTKCMRVGRRRDFEFPFKCMQMYSRNLTP